MKEKTEKMGSLTGKGEERVSVSGNLSITEKYKKYLYTDVDYKDPYWYYNGKC